jgi:inorganic triphosphatase YgiF
MEIEAKFKLLNPSEEDLNRLKAIYVRAGYGVEVNPDPIDIIDVYFDRTDHALRREGAAIRIRKEDGDVLLTFKRKLSQEGALHSRVEVEARPTQDHIRRVYGELEKLDLSLAKDRPRYIHGIKLEDFLKGWGLVPMLEIRTKRCRLDVRDRDGALAFVVLDRVQFQHGARQGGYSGIEIEASDDEDVEIVMRLSGILKAEWGRGIQEQAISKYEFALESMGVDP